MNYRETLTVYSPAYLGNEGLEETGMIQLPTFVLQQITDHMTGQLPIMLFELINPRLGNRICCGVQDFTTEPGTVCVPYWMMDHLQVGEGEHIEVRSVQLPVATKAVFQPTDASFDQLPNTKAILEYTLRQFKCLTQGSTLKIVFNSRPYYLKVLKTEPAPNVSIFRADVVCEFAPPVNSFDHKWNTPDTDESSDESEVLDATPFRGNARTTNGKVIYEEEKPIHSTLAKRDAERRSRQHTAGIRVFESGQEILPPKPKERRRKDGKKKEAFFQGEGRRLRGPSGASSASISREVSAETMGAEPTSNAFKGKGRTLR